LKPDTGVLFTATRDDKVIDVYKGLIKHGFLSVPVLQKTKNLWHGFIDLSDIVTCIIAAFGDLKMESEKDFWTAIDRDEAFQKKLVKDVVRFPLTRRNPFYPLLKGFSLFTAIEALAKYPNLHRIPVIDHDRKLVDMITQSQVISFFNKNINLLGAIKNKPIHFIPSARSTVAKISDKETAIEAFKLLHFKEISGLAVVDDNDRLVGAISASDLKLIRYDGGSFGRLYETIHKFLLKAKREGVERPPGPVVLSPNDTIEVALKKFQENGVHRLFVVDEKMHAIGVVALKDILLEIISE